MTNGKEVIWGRAVTDNTTLGTIVYSDKEGDCEYVIKTDDGVMFDPYKYGRKLSIKMG